MEKFSKRLKYAMELRDITQSELCRLTSIPKSAMSQYISGNFKPKQKRTYALSDALNVSPAWLMGYDVPIDWVENTTPDTPTSHSIDIELSSEIARLIKTDDEWTKRFIIKLLRMPPQNREIFKAMLTSITGE